MVEPENTLEQSPEERQQARLNTDSLPEISGYEISDKLGTGSFGTVFRGVQKSTGQAVAIKVLHREGVDYSYFQHELIKLGQLAQHPHVVSLLDADMNHRPPYYVMPLLATGSLANQEATPEWVGQVVDWFAQIAAALNYMHGKGLLHCDLKPSNVLLDDQGRSLLVDFGQATQLGDHSGAFGTLGYMPPEQSLPGSQPDIRWDVYGLGATIYRLLTGQCPRFSAGDRTQLSGTPESSQRLQLYRQWLTERPLTSMQHLNPKVDPDLAEIIQSCLEVDPERRTPSVLQVLEDLERRRSGEPLLCRRPWSARYQVVRFLSRPLIALSLLVAIALPMFVNTYLTVKARKAITEQLLNEAQLVNQLTAERLKDNPAWNLLDSRDGYQHILMGPDHKVPPQIDLVAMEQESGRPDGGYYHRGSTLLVGAWSKLGPSILLSEKEAHQGLQAVDDLLAKNQLLNGLILLTAAGVATVVVRLSRR